MNRNKIVLSSKGRLFIVSSKDTNERKKEKKKNRKGKHPITMNVSHLKEKLLSIMGTKLYTQLPPAEISQTYNELKYYLDLSDPQLSEEESTALSEMLFYLSIYMSKDIEAEVIYKSLCDRLGENSPRLHVMKATLIQINEDDIAATKYLQNLIDKEYEFDSDPTSYLLLAKKILAIKAELQELGKLDNESGLLSQIIDLVERFPLDPELWWYLGTRYCHAGQYDRAIYCFEEVLLIMPFNYVGFAQLAEVMYYKAESVRSDNTQREVALKAALNNALRSVELSETCLRGWTLIAVISKRLGTKPLLLDLATKKLQEISNSPNMLDKVTAEFILEKEGLVTKA